MDDPDSRSAVWLLLLAINKCGLFASGLDFDKLNPYYVNILLAGYDKETGPSLYYTDYIATLHKLEKGAFGHGSYFLLSMISRLVVAPTNFVIKIVEKDCARGYAWRESVKDTPVIQLELIMFLILIKLLYFRLSFNNSTFCFHFIFSGFEISLKTMVSRL
ncbi:Proteasome subunit beta type-2-A [Trifolium repens]|nr:Proteasome subunit beta type-2-A [Trifolium repens]